MAHQCPWCELRYAWSAELAWHMRDDHAPRQLARIPSHRRGDHDDSSAVTLDAVPMDTVPLDAASLETGAGVEVGPASD
jgi:hypothetical protein